MAPLFRYALFSALLAQCPCYAVTVGSNMTNTLAVALVPVAPTLGFGASKWIWTTTTTANAFVALRKGFTPPLGKSLVAAEVIITAFNQMQFFVNGDFVGTGTPSHGRMATRFCVNLLPSFNVFTVNASTTTTDGGVLATIQLTYADGTTDTLVTDSSWRATKGLPAGFAELSFDDTTWTVATVLASYSANPWGLMNIPANPHVLALDRAQWIWTDVVPASGKLPAGSRAFRRSFTPAPGQGLTPMSASIIVAADDSYTLFVNGVMVGTGKNVKVAQHYTINFTPTTTEIVLAVFATNAASSVAGVIVASEINMQSTSRAAGCTPGSFVVSDAVWKSTKSVIPAGWEQPGFDDSTWPAAVDEGGYGVATWGKISVAAPSAPITV